MCQPQANLLGGRVVRHERFGQTSGEIAEGFDLVRALDHGFLSRHHLAGTIARESGVPAPAVKGCFEVGFVVSLEPKSRVSEAGRGVREE